LFMKIVLADRVALYANTVFAEPGSFTGLPLILAMYAYAIQIYFDFAGYTDMALGMARFFGIRLSENFASPYSARSVMEFWRRWHMSFSKWILGYIFKPLQLSWRSLGKAGTAFALGITFLASGLWHGFGWGFAAWGALHGLFLIISVFTRPYRERILHRLRIKDGKILDAFRILSTFHLVCLAWIFFRAQKIEDAVYITRNLFNFRGAGSASGPAQVVRYLKDALLLGIDRIDLFVIFGALVVLFLLRKGNMSDLFHKPAWMRYVTYYGLLFSILILGISSSSQFVYFQF